MKRFIIEVLRPSKPLYFITSLMLSCILLSVFSDFCEKLTLLSCSAVIIIDFVITMIISAKLKRMYLIDLLFGGCLHLSFFFLVSHRSPSLLLTEIGIAIITAVAVIHYCKGKSHRILMNIRAACGFTMLLPIFLIQ